jgi:hypothetical protein
MAYGDTFRKTSWTSEDLATSIEGLLIDVNTATGTFLSTSSGNVTIATITLTLEAGESVLLIGDLTYSTSTAQDVIGFNLYRDATALLTRSRWSESSKGTTSGQQSSASASTIDVPSVAGTYSYTLQFFPNSSTAYIDIGQLTTATFRSS